MTPGEPAPASPDKDETVPTLPYLSSDRVALAPHSRPPTPPLAKAIALGVPLALYAVGIGGGAMLPPISLAIFVSLVTVWWVVFRSRTYERFPRIKLHVLLSAIAFTGALVMFCGRVGDATEGASGLRYWTDDNPGYRYGRHHAMRIAPFVLVSTAWFVAAAIAFLLRARRERADATACSQASQPQ